MSKHTEVIRRRHLATVAAYARDHGLEAFVIGQSVTVWWMGEEVEVTTVDEIRALKP